MPTTYMAVVSASSTVSVTRMVCEVRERGDNKVNGGEPCRSVGEAG